MKLISRKKIQKGMRLLRGLLYRKLYSVKGGMGLQIGKDVFFSRGLISCGTNVVISDYSEIRGKVSLSDNILIHRNVLLHSQGGHIRIGAGSTVNPFVCIYGHGGVTIGALVSIATKVTIVAANHAFQGMQIPIKGQGVTRRGIQIEDDVWIGANAVILDGVTVQKGGVVGAGAVVTRSFEPYTIVAGVPAKVIGRRSLKK